MRPARLLRAAPMLVGAPALAQSGGDPPPIIVTGASLARPPGEAAYDVAVIDRDRLTDEASGRLENILRDVAGFAQYRRSDSRSAQPTSQGATLRGLGGNAASRALVLLDGVPLSDPFGGWISFAAIDPERLGLVRVTRGGGAGAAGPGALAGTIELSSATPQQLAPAWLRAGYGSRASREAEAGLSGAMAGGFAFLTASYAAGDGFVPISQATRGPADMAAPYRQISVAGRAVLPIAAEVELQASGLVFTDRRTRGTAFTPNRTEGEDASLRLVGRGRWGFEALAYLQARTFAAGFASLDDGRTRATATLDQYGVPSMGSGGRLEIRPPIAERLTLRLGADGRFVSGETDELYSYVATVPTRRREAGGRAATLGGFAEASWDAAEGLSLTAGGRIDHWQLSHGFLNQQQLATGATLDANRFADRAGWRPTGRGGVAWKPADGPVTLRAAAYLGWRLPTLNELYRLYRVGADAIAANPALAPERLKGVDGGIDYDPLPTLHLAATLFANRLGDAIANVTLAPGPGIFPQVGSVSAAGRYQMRENLDAIVSRGAELDARLALGAWALSASYAFTDARVHASGAARPLDGLRPAQTARHAASATLGWQRRQGVAASATLRYVGPQFEDDQNSLVLRGAVTLDGSLRLPLSRAAAVELRAENLTNTLVMAALSSDGTVERATPRTIWISFRYGNPRGG
ncbi:TonB-dependent receptor [Sphingomonas morindae]|uniref:TonB-dependent receptor n=1 Tax=Sphingomonas morindae TaxID=1541170 RepID=A0ABY4X5B5_9SPHN|nr:TonB-dependent receptor [Sphingomonas morindae]USI72083.1 TonB-dependent receptor [Sphingomonas morindae]